MRSIIHLSALTCLIISLAHASVTKSKKRKASIALRDTNTHVEDVQPTCTSTVIPSTPQPVSHGDNTTQELVKMSGKVTSYCLISSLSYIFTEMIRTERSSLSSNLILGDHTVGFHFHCVQDMLSLKLALSDRTKGQITIKLKFLQHASKGTEESVKFSNSSSAPLKNEMVLPLCKLYDLQTLITTKVSVNLSIEMLIESAPQDVSKSFPSHAWKFPKKIRTIKHLKKLITNGKYGEVTMINYTMTKEQSSKCLCPAITTLEHYNSLYDYLKHRDMLSSFLIHGNIKVVRGVITEIKYDDFLDFVGRTGILEAIASSITENRYERAIELYGSAHMKDKRKDRSIVFKIFVSHSLDRLAPLKNSMPVKRFLTLSGNEFSNKYPDTFDVFCRILIHHLRCGSDVPKAEKLLTDFIGQPSMLTSVAFTNAFLYHVTDGEYLNFIKLGWREAIREGLKRDNEHGGEKLWQVMTDKSPEKFFGEYPSSEEALVDVLAYFPTKQRLEYKWMWENVSKLQKRLESLRIYSLSTTIWTTIAEYVISSWLDVD